MHRLQVIPGHGRGPLSMLLPGLAAATGAALVWSLLGGVATDADIVGAPIDVPASAGTVALGSVAASVHVISAQPGLVTPVDLGALELDARGEYRVLLVEQPLNRRWRLFKGLSAGHLLRAAPAREVQPHGAHCQLDAAANLDQFSNRLARTQRLDHLQLIGRAVADQPLHLALLLGADGAASANRMATAVDIHRHPVAGLVGPWLPCPRRLGPQIVSPGWPFVLAVLELPVGDFVQGRSSEDDLNDSPQTKNFEHS